MFKNGFILGHRLCFKVDLFCLIKLFPLVYIFIESAHFISRIIKYSLSEYLIIPFMLRSTWDKFKQFYLLIPSYKYIPCVTISVYKFRAILYFSKCFIQHYNYVVSS